MHTNYIQKSQFKSQILGQTLQIKEILPIVLRTVWIVQGNSLTNQTRAAVTDVAVTDSEVIITITKAEDLTLSGEWVKKNRVETFKIPLELHAIPMDSGGYFVTVKPSRLGQSWCTWIYPEMTDVPKEHQSEIPETAPPPLPERSEPLFS